MRTSTRLTLTLATALLAGAAFLGCGSDGDAPGRALRQPGKRDGLALHRQTLRDGLAPGRIGLDQRHLGARILEGGGEGEADGARAQDHDAERGDLRHARTFFLHEFT